MDLFSCRYLSVPFICGYTKMVEKSHVYLHGIVLSRTESPTTKSNWMQPILFSIYDLQCKLMAVFNAETQHWELQPR